MTATTLTTVRSINKNQFSLIIINLFSLSCDSRTSTPTSNPDTSKVLRVMSTTERSDDTKKGQPEKLHIQLTHVKQKYSWDCGVSCVLMVLPRLQRQHLLKNLSKICKDEGFHSSTWTIDLCYLLKRYQIGHIFYTMTLGVHPGYHGNSFYTSILTKDEARVNQKFKQAEKGDISIVCASVAICDILEHLVNGPVIVLTNGRLLNCDICKFNKVSTEFRKCLPWTPPYQGHYVVLCGYDMNSRKVHYRNPSFADRVCVMSVDVLEEARKSYGTDQDVILVYT